MCVCVLIGCDGGVGAHGGRSASGEKEWKGAEGNNSHSSRMD